MNKLQTLLVAAAFLPLGAVGFVAIEFGRGALEARHYRERIEGLAEEGELLLAAGLDASDSEEAQKVRRGLARIRTSLDGLFEELGTDSVRLRAGLDEAEWSLEHRAEVERQLGRYAGFFVAVQELVDAPESAAVLERRERILGEPPQLAEIREWGNLLLVRARLDVGRGAPDSAAERIAQGLALTRLLESGRSFGVLISLSLRELLLDGAEDLVDAGRLDPRILIAAIGDALRRDAHEEWLDWILRSELSAVHGLGARGPELGNGVSGFLSYPDECRRALQDLEDRLQGLERIGQPAAERGDLPAAFDRNLVTTVERARSREALLLVILAARAYQAAEGDWPESLDLLRPFLDGSVPDDPWTGAPFSYERRVDGWILGPMGGAASSGFEAQRRARELYVLH